VRKEKEYNRNQKAQYKRGNIPMAVMHLLAVFEFATTVQLT
jgi:hypothetical protein